jgi:hypothetical protein
MRELFVRTLKKGGLAPTDIDYLGEADKEAGYYLFGWAEI